MKKIFIFALNFCLVFNFSLTPIISLAQEEGGPPADVQKGPSAEELKQFEQEMGAPPAAFDHGGPAPVDTEEIKSLPADVKEYASDQELVAIYCAMTKWKSGDFFSAMDALQKYMVPAIEKVKALGIDIQTPDPGALKADGQKKLEAICSATTVDEAERLARDFQSWGQTEARDKMGTQMSQELDEKMKAKGDVLREKVQAEVKVFVDQETKTMEEEIKQMVDRLVESKKSQLESMAKTNPTGAQAAANNSRGEIDSQVQAFVNTKISQMKEKIKVKVEEIVGPQKKQFEEIGASLSEAGSKIDEEIKANRSKYDSYKEGAFSLRKNLVFKMLDKNLADGLAKLEAGSADIESARQKDPTIKSVAEIKASLAEDRKALDIKLNAALEAGDDAAFEQVLLDFKTKWEGYRTEMEKVAKQSLDKACAAATAQFGQGRTQIDTGIKQITDLQQKCVGTATDECASVNEFADRFGTILGKFNDIKTEMGVAEKMCAAPEQADKDSLMSLMKKIQADAEDLKTYGQALEAQKQKAIADSAKKVCDTALPQINAAQAEIQKNDMVVLKNNLDKCAGKNTPECESVNSLRGEYDKVTASVKEFVTDKAQVVKFCSASTGDSDLMQMQAVLSNLKQEGDEIRVAAKDLQAKQAEKASAKSFCRAISGSISMATTGLTGGLKDITSEQKSCAGKTDEKCKVVNTFTSKFDTIKNNLNAALKKASKISTSCNTANTNPPSQDLIAKAESFKKDEADIKNAVDVLRAQIDKAILNAKGSISFEAESAASYNTRTGVSNPMTRETNPSWRPSYFGSGDWYMGAGGDYLNYNFNSPADGKYNIWVRDYVDKFQPRGVRRIIVEFDGKKYGVFGETTVSAPGDKGAFGWHKIGEGIQLAAGAHKMKITKEASTVGAAILDAFYFTTGNETPKEK